VEWRICKSGGEGATGGIPDDTLSGSAMCSGKLDATIAIIGKSNVEIERLLIVKSYLLALASGVLRRSGCLGFAMTVRRAAAFHSRPHEVLFAGDATAPDEGCEKQQRKERTG